MLPVTGRTRRGQLAIAFAFALLAAPASAAAERPTTPELIEQAQQSGKVDATRATQLRAYALAAPSRLPAEYRSNAPWDGTLTLLRVQRAVKRLPKGRARDEVNALAGPSASAVTSCDADSSGNLPNDTTTTNFYIQYDTVGGGLTIDAYKASIQGAWDKEVGSFGWAAPPLKATPAGARYHVRVDGLGFGLYGYVSTVGTYAGPVGDNPNTAWNEGDAYATCMALNEDYSGFPSTPQNSLDSTTAHEFNHSLQFGYGALTGANAPAESFIEGGATWMEDEVYDSSNDNYNYLWPDFRQSMSSYDPSFAYSYWIAFRGITERYGTGTSGQGEDVMQDFWERTSKNESGNLNSMEQAVLDKGVTNLPDAFHNYAIAVKFSKSCGGGNGLFPPDCFEEGNGYSAAAGGQPASDKSIATIPGSATDTVADAYAIQWTSLPASGSAYSVRLTNSSAGGLLKGTVACNPGAGAALSRQPLPSTVGAGQSTTLKSFNPAGCSSRVLVTTNSAHATPKPAAPANRAMQVQTLALQSLTVSKAGSGSGQVSSSPAGIDCGADCSEQYTSGTSVMLTATPSPGSLFTGWSGSGCSGTGTCTVTMDGTKAVTANFEPSSPPGQETLSTSVVGTGTGSVTSNPAGIDCPASSCSHNYDEDTDVSLTATPAAGSSFAGWSGSGCSGTGGCSVVMDGPKDVTASFQPTTSSSGGGSNDGAPGGSQTMLPALDLFPPALGSLRLSASRFRAAPARGKKPPVGTRVRFSLSEAAKVGFRVERRLPGRRVGSSCRKPSASNRSKARCTRRVLAGSFSRSGRSGSNSFVFHGRPHGRKLKPGSYRFVVVARDVAGNASSARRKRFRIVR